MKVIPPFPEHRTRDPKRLAELAVYRELEATDAPGTAIYEAKVNRNTPEVDFAIWIEGAARYAMQVKGGIHRPHGGSWYLSTPRGEVRKPTPLSQLWDSTMRLHDCLQEQLGRDRNPFWIPVLLLADMEPDPAIEAWADHSHVQVIFGTDNQVEQLLNLAPRARQLYPPTAEEIAEEAALVMPGLPGPEAPTEIPARQVDIQHAEQVQIVIDTGEGQVKIVIQHADLITICTVGGETEA